MPLSLPRRVAQAIAAHIENGCRLGDALAKTPSFLPPQVNAILQAGEKLGDLKKVLPACREVLRRAAPKPDARHAVIHAEQGYTTNLPVQELLNDDVLLADKHDGADLSPEHGWPLRLVVPRRYFWKSAKWVRAIELVAADRPGFWEENGYHNDADPWKEERFSDW